MADEAKGTEEGTPEGTTEKPEVVLEGADISDNVDDPNAGTDFAPLFESETVTEAELMGEDDTAGDTETADPEAKGEDDPEKKADKKETEKKTEVEDKPDTKTETEEKPESETEKKETEKVDETVSKELEEKKAQVDGLNTALRQERDENSRLKEENKRLATELEKSKAPKVDDKEAEKWKDFKPLTDKEFETLNDEDPDEATKYLYKYNRWRDYQADVNKRQQTENESKNAERAIINKGYDAIEEILPGASEGKNDMANTLAEFAEKNGLSTGALEILADPRTKVTTADGQSFIIGVAAAQLVKLLKSTHEAVSNVPDPEKLKTEIEAELRPKIEAEIQEQVIKKIQNDPTGASFRSLDTVTGGDRKEAKPVHTGILTEADYAKMSESEQEAFLSGA